MSENLLQGTVKWFDLRKGYGFITDTDGKDYFVHFSAIQSDGFRSLEQGEAVEFEFESTPKGLQAVKVYKKTRA